MTASKNSRTKKITKQVKRLVEDAQRIGDAYAAIAEIACDDAAARFSQRLHEIVGNNPVKLDALIKCDFNGLKKKFGSYDGYYVFKLSKKKTRPAGTPDAEYVQLTLQLINLDISDDTLILAQRIRQRDEDDLDDLDDLD